MDHLQHAGVPTLAQTFHELSVQTMRHGLVNGMQWSNKAHKGSIDEDIRQNPLQDVSGLQNFPPYDAAEEDFEQIFRQYTNTET